jgi:peptide/nickel transport system substrate-binding protein
LVNSIMNGGAQVHQSFWASGFWAALDDNPYKLDPDKAKALLRMPAIQTDLKSNLMRQIHHLL